MSLSSLFRLVGIAHARCPLARAVAVAVREVVDDRETRRHVTECQTQDQLDRLARDLRRAA